MLIIFLSSDVGKWLGEFSCDLDVSYVVTIADNTAIEGITVQRYDHGDITPPPRKNCPASDCVIPTLSAANCSWSRCGWLKLNGSKWTKNTISSFHPLVIEHSCGQWPIHRFSMMVYLLKIGIPPGHVKLPKSNHLSYSHIHVNVLLTRHDLRPKPWTQFKPFRSVWVMIDITLLHHASTDINGFINSHK